MGARRFVKSFLFVGIPLAAIAALVTFWDWDWLIPILQARASSALGRQVTIAHLHVQFGRVTTVIACELYAMHLQRAHDSIQVIALDARRRRRIDLHQLVVKKWNPPFRRHLLEFAADVR